MGWIRHHAIIVTSGDESALIKAHQVAVQCGFEEIQVSNIVEGVINGYFSFFVGPDGSKEGWDASDIGNERRDNFIVWLREQRHLDWVEVQYGDDYKETIIVRHRDEMQDNEEW